MWEWSGSRYGSGYYGQSPDRDPIEPQKGDTYVLRGGSWFLYNPDYLRAAYRYNYSDYPNVDLGFRVAQLPRT